MGSSREPCFTGSVAASGRTGPDRLIHHRFQCPIEDVDFRFHNERVTFHAAAEIPVTDLVGWQREVKHL